MWDQYYYQHQDIDHETTNAAGLTWDDQQQHHHHQHQPPLDIHDIDFNLDLDLISESQTHHDAHQQRPPPPAYRSVSPVLYEHHSATCSSLSPDLQSVTNAAAAAGSNPTDITKIITTTTAAAASTPKIHIKTALAAKKKQRSGVLATPTSSFKADSKRSLLLTTPVWAIPTPSPCSSLSTSRVSPSVLTPTPGMNYHQRLAQSGPHEVPSSAPPPLFAISIEGSGSYRGHHMDQQHPHPPQQGHYQLPQSHMPYPGQPGLGGGHPHHHHGGPHGLSSSAPTDHTESWAAAMTSRAPPGASAAAAASGSSWAYPGTGGVGGMDVAGGQNGPGGLRYASEETVAELTKEEKRARRKEQNRLAQQDLRRRRMEHTSNLETKVEELIRMLDKKDTEIRMLQDIVKQLQRDGKTAPGVNEILNESTLLAVPNKEEWTTHSNASTSSNPPVSPIQGMRPLAIRRMSSSFGPINGRHAIRRPSDVKVDENGKLSSMDLMQPPGYSPVSLGVPINGPMYGRSGPQGRVGGSEGYPTRFPGHPVGPGMKNPGGGQVWSAPAGTVDFPADIHQGYGQISPVAGRRPSIVGYTGMEGNNVGYKMGGGNGPAPMVAGPSHYSPGMSGYPKTTTGVHPHHDLLGLNGIGSMKSHSAIEYHQQGTYHPHSAGPAGTMAMSDARDTGDSCPSNLSTNSGLPSLSDVEDAVNQVVPGYEARSSNEGGFVYPGGGLFHGASTNETRVGAGVGQ